MNTAPDLQALYREVVPALQDSNTFLADLQAAAGLEDDLFNPLPPEFLK